MADDVKTNRGLIVGTAQPAGAPRLRSMHSESMYPGKLDTIQSASNHPWSKDPWSSVVIRPRTGPDSCAASGRATAEPHGRVSLLPERIATT